MPGNGDISNSIWKYGDNAEYSEAFHFLMEKHLLMMTKGNIEVL